MFDALFVTLVPFLVAGLVAWILFWCDNERSNK